MKTIADVISNYSEYETLIEDRFGARLCNFLTQEQADSIGFRLKDGIEEWGASDDWTRENILEQLRKDVEFGWEKACGERGISSSLMYEVVRSWNRVLEEGLEDFDEYDPYGRPLFAATAEKYGWTFGGDAE